jgi:hypothetical protein
MRLADVDYHQFMARLTRAGEKGERIEKKDKKKWKAYVREHGVYEAAALMHARNISEVVEAVIIDSEDDWNGYYLYSQRDVICLKFLRKG